MTASKPRPRKTPKNSFTTSSGKTIKLNRSIGERVKASREAKAQRKAAYLSTLPKERWKRTLYRLHPKRLYKYWFSRDGAIMALKITGVGLVVVFLLIVGLFAYFRKDLPKIQDINNGNDGGGNVSYYDHTGQTLLFHDSGAFKRLPVKSDEISPYMKDATIAVEDKEFYHEGAFNIRGIVRAAINNLKGGSTQGGSTITQQLVKLNEGWTSDHTISRKVKELILAVELEREYSKDDILSAYLNMAPYSGTDYGVQAAAQDYFHTNAKDLKLEQAAMLAAIPKAPTAYSPYSSPVYNSQASGYLFDQNGLIARQQYIIGLMQRQGYIKSTDAEIALKTPIMTEVNAMPTDHYAGIKYPYFVMAARDQLQNEVPKNVIKNGDLKVITTLDTGVQDIADKALSDHLNLLKRYSADNAAFVAEDTQTGQVDALIGGIDFNNPTYGKINYATDVNISPGSSVKPYDYTNFINSNTNVGAGSVLYDQTGPLPGYPCDIRTLPSGDPNNPGPGDCLYDYDRRGRGPITLRYAMGASLNIPAVKSVVSSVPGDTSAGRVTSINKNISTMKALMDNPDGYRCYNSNIEDFFSAQKTDEAQCYAASAIGDGAYLHLNDHVNGIASIGREGLSIPQTFILKVTNSSGKVIQQWTQPKGTQVVKQDSAYIVDNMASDPKASYLSGSCGSTDCTGMKFHRYKGWTNAIKTGTTNYNFDGLMMSWNPKFTAGIWIGNHTRTKPFTTSPENITDPIMKQFMQGAIDSLGNVKAEQFQAPSDIKQAPAFVYTAGYLGQQVPSPSTDIYPSWYVGKVSTTSTTIDKVSGKIATACTPAAARQTVGGGSVSALNVDVFMGGSPSASTAPSTNTPQDTDTVHACADADHMPSATITAVNGIPTGSSTTLTCPSTGCTIMVHIEQGAHPLSDPQYASVPGTSTLALIVNGQTVQSQPVTSPGDYMLTYTPPAGSTGSIQVTAQVTDSVLYQGSDTQSITVATTTTSFRKPTTGGGTGNGRGKNGSLGYVPPYVYAGSFSQ